MKDEIKEFEEFRNDEDGTYFYYIDKDGNEQWSYKLDNLKDYITNLQKENKKIKDDKDGWHRVAQRNYNELLDRIDKAIEYINKNKHLSMFCDCREPEEDWNYVLEINPRDLLNILSGDDKE